VAPRFRRLALPLGDLLARSLEAFDCLGPDHDGDPVAENVNGFLTDGRFESGLRHGVSATYVLVDPTAAPALIGYVALSFDSVRLTNAEKKRMEDLTGVADFGALRIQMIGIDQRHQCRGHGHTLLRGVTGLARMVSHDVAVRYLLADANVNKVPWYENAGFVRNRAQKEIDRLNPERSISMRLDLLEAHPAQGRAS
jgi:ribosomal protein S18 acetylase RimI-like enzyme